MTDSLIQFDQHPGVTDDRYDFGGEDLRGCTFENDDLSDCNFQNADLRGCKLWYFWWRAGLAPDFRGADLRGADVDWKRLFTTTKYEKAYVTPQQHHRIRLICPELAENLFILGENDSLYREGRKGGAAEPDVLERLEKVAAKSDPMRAPMDLFPFKNRADYHPERRCYEESFLREISFDGCDLSGYDFANADLQRTDLRGWTWTEESPNFRGADLRGAEVDWEELFATGKWHRAIVTPKKKEELLRAFGSWALLLTSRPLEPSDTTEKPFRGLEDWTPTEDKTMSNTQAEALKTAVMRGAAMGAASAGGDVLLSLAENLGKDIPAVQLALQTEDGRELVKALLALAIHTLADRTEMVPKADLVKKGMEVQISASTMRLAQKHLATVFAAIPRLLESDLIQNPELASSTRCRVETHEEAEELHACDNVSALKTAVAD